MIKKTKIIATLGPSSESPEKLAQLINNGTNIFRFNLKHNDFEWHKSKVAEVKEVAKRLGKKIGILVDFQGPEIRIETENGENIDLETDESLFLAEKFIKGKKSIKVNPKAVLKQIDKGNTVFIDDGDGEFEVISKRLGVLELKSKREYVVKNKKSMNVPGKKLELPLLSMRDKEALIRLDEFEADFAALSFVRDEQDVEVFKKLLANINSKAKVIAKIENASAIKNIEKIVEYADGIMVARGDLGIEIPIRELAFWQKKIIDLCRKNSKPVIVATQMLKSMIENYRPTRAEVSDVSNAIYDGTDAVMLSEETALGRYPVRAVEEMSNIAVFCENNGDVNNIKIETNELTEILVEAAIKIVKDNQKFPIKAVIIFTQSGKTARIFSRYRLNVPIIAFTNNLETVENLSLSYGVEAYLKKFEKTNFKISVNLINELTKFEFINQGDNLLLIHGNNWMETGSTSDISLVTV